MTRDPARPGRDQWDLLPPTELVAVVPTAPPPQIPLASLREHLAPVHDDEGDLVDWTLTASPFDDHDAVVEFRRWRRSWCRTWPVGSVAHLDALRDEAHRLDADLAGDLDDLLGDVLAADGAPVTVSPARAGRVAPQVELLRIALSVDDRTGVGVVDDMPALTRGIGLARTWPPPVDEVVLAATPGTAVLLRPGQGLVLRHGADQIELVDVTGVDLRGDLALVINARGTTVRLTQDEARPLGWIVPRSLRWHLRTIPLVAVWAVTFDGLHAALVTAASEGVPCEIGADSGLR